MNVIGSRPDGWWRDRREAMRRLASHLGRYAEETGDAVTIVFDGGPFELPEAGTAEVVFSPGGGRDAADDRIADLVAGDRDPASLSVVTSDRRLAERTRERGAKQVGSRSFERMVEEALGRRRC